MLTADDLSNFLAKKAEERWTVEQQPYFLSSVAPELKANGRDYRSAIGEEKLKAFAKRIGSSSGFKVVEHPTQKSKIGIVPVNSNFAFEESDQSKHQQSDLSASN